MARKTPYRCDPRAYEHYYCQQVGRGLSVFSGGRNYRGGGLGSLLSGIGRAVMPLLKNTGKALLKQGVTSGLNIAQDVLSGQNLKSSFNKRAKEAGQSLLQRASNSVTRPQPSVRGIKRTAPRRQRQKNGKKKKKKNSDIFG